ncbi:DNA repair exonuclease [Ameyamaea chiangmaiensis NBRC 103196]|uniref:DNA repair exonuclease n=1 Tax=Ameyamaea chiangmaiensis TaxID=442969 RepID=A0A850P8V4_9PROT|nr:DNA repair exonuclease [Ameyamaea chiangmaiensis]MBS4074326.1 DNA repair exonuclease [Ameyamaea chiangmaiensis]NVN41045.1 DNA repair exonuclease [Ameyamaea chiangmaiensis]GBQ71654.1 DNA repair exonuclease [Ameyamaea chiangmaiensis NBRC 103196]
MRVLHTSDWQIGKTFRFADDDTLRVLQDERLEAIGRVARAARTHGACAVLVAGDIYDVEIPSDRTLRQPMERMRQFPQVQWHLIPGNHDPHTPEGPWARLRDIGVPDNVTLHLENQRSPLVPGSEEGWVLPAVLRHRHMMGDPTTAMDDMPTPEGALRLGLAHGSVTGFGSDDTANLIAPDRARRAGLGYLALGDWHGYRAIDARTTYSGTPEPDGFDRGGDGGGHAVLVSFDGPQALPVREMIPVGRFRWHRARATLTTGSEVEALEAHLRGLDPEDLSRVLLWLEADGALGLDDFALWDERIVRGLGSAFRLLRIGSAPTVTSAPADIERLSGAVRGAAERLRERASGDEHAAAALARLFALAGGRA